MENLDLQPDPESADTQFVSAQQHKFQGKPLHVCDIHRQFAAQTLGNKVLSGGVRLKAKAGAYDGMFLDVLVLIWLCSVANTDVLDAIEDPAAGRARALEWAESLSMGIGSDAFSEACEIFGEIMKEIHDAQFRVEDREGDSPKK